MSRRPPRVWLLLAIGGFSLGTALEAPPAEAGKCQHGTNCPVNERDATGCCKAPVKAPPSVAPSPVAPPAPKPAPTSCPAEMAGIPAGTYKLGATLTPATVSAYCLDLTEVTVAAYQKCVDADGCTEPTTYVNKVSWDRFCNWKRSGRGAHPINCVDWDQSVAYCAWAKKRLPTEEEWEWAARNGDRGDTYPWGSTALDGSQANACGSECVSNVKTKMFQNWKPMYWADDGWPETAPVSSFPNGDNRWGVHDLSGNVWEWTSSSFSASSPDRVSRGGGWGSGFATMHTVWHRGNAARVTRSVILGFRCARTP